MGEQGGKRMFLVGKDYNYSLVTILEHNTSLFCFDTPVKVSSEKSYLMKLKEGTFRASR